ncbi:MAG TPA: hypothetical protein VMM78_13310 [Thermomicrobiales bacterium]|nr:hypothetical protein [Thermomicrobiales bacterium]
MTTLALAGLVVIAVVVFLFVLEPILRAKCDVALLDAAALPRDEQESYDPAPASGDEASGDLQQGEPENDQPAIAARRVSSDVV